MTRFREFQKLKELIYAQVTSINKLANRGIRFNHDKDTDWKEAAGDELILQEFLKAIKLKDTLREQ